MTTGLKLVDTRRSAGTGIGLRLNVKGRSMSLVKVNLLSGI
jgi:hypothetical protein